MSISVVLKNAASTVGEGPHWDAASRTLWHVDILANDVHRYDVTTGNDSKIHLDSTVSFAIPTHSNPDTVVIGLGRKIALLDYNTGSVTDVLAEVDHGTNNRFNDGKCDANGRLWAGTMGYESRPASPERQKGSLYSMETGKLRHHVDKIDISNGLAWTEDNSKMYYIDSLPRKVYVFDYDIITGDIANQRVAVDFGEGTLPERGHPDGCCLDNEGKLWVACFGAGKVIHFDPQTGKELQTLNFPAKNITSCCFGGDNLDELYVTSSRFGIKEEDLKLQPLAGSVFKVTGLGVKGMPMYNYKDK